MCRDYLLDLDRIDKQTLEDNHIKIVIISPSPVGAIKTFVLEKKFGTEMFSDSPRKVFTALHLPYQLSGSNTTPTTSPHIKTSLTSSIFQGIYHGIKNVGGQGDFRQQGGSFILGPGNTCTFAHYDQSVYDHMHIPELLKKLELPETAFTFREKV